MKQPFCTPAQALRRVLDAAAALPVPATERVPLDDACGRIAARDLCARMDQPPFDRSPLDGYALHSADTAGAGEETPVTLPVVMKLYAGDAGAPIAAAGTVLTPAHIGVLAGQGIPDAEVFRPMTVGVLATGSELLEAGEAWAPGKIYDANGIQNAARLRQLGFAVERTHCSDDPEEIAARMQDLLTRCDAVITSGGVSVGQKDYLPTVLDMLHVEPVFAGVAQKPGSPMIAAQVGEKLVFCLSGNPFAAAATLEQYAVPALLRAAGRREEDCIPVHTRGRLTTGFSKPSKGTRFLRARALGGLVEIPGEGNAEAHSSGSLSAMMGCNCLVELPAGSGPVAPGEEVEVLNFVQ